LIRRFGRRARAGLHDLGDQFDAIGLLSRHGGSGAALALARNDHAALAGLAQRGADRDGFAIVGA